MPAVSLDTAWFEAGVCRNCGHPSRTRHCAHCGQKTAQRFVWRDLGKEGWERLRFFELRLLRTIVRLVTAPGTVAREYVLGRRTAYMHPLTLLIALVAALVVMLGISQYFTVYAFSGRDAEVERMAQRVVAYANWSFSLGIVAIFAASWTVFRRRLGYNAIEHAVLAIYCQDIVLVLVLLNLLPTLIWHDPAFVIWHKQASQYYVPAIKMAIVAIAFRQFFLLKLRTDWPALLAACALYAVLNWVLLRGYAAAVLWLVTKST